MRGIAWKILIGLVLGFTFLVVLTFSGGEDFTSLKKDQFYNRYNDKRLEAQVHKQEIAVAYGQIREEAACRQSGIILPARADTNVFCIFTSNFSLLGLLFGGASGILKQIIDFLTCLIYAVIYYIFYFLFYVFWYFFAWSIGIIGVSNIDPTTQEALELVLGEQNAHRFIQLATTPSGMLEDTHVVDLWSQCRNAANSVVILILLLIGLAEILHLKVDTYGIKKMMPTLIMAIVAGNFSLVFCRVVLDTVAVATDFLSQIGAGGFANEIKGIFPTFTGEGLSRTVEFVGVLIYAILLMVTLLILAIIYIMRRMMLLVLAVLAPLAFMSMAFPPTQKWFKMWMDNFIKWTFAPIYTLLFLVIGGQLYKIPFFQLPLINIAATAPILYFAITSPFKLGALGMAQASKGFGWLGQQANNLRQSYAGQTRQEVDPLTGETRTVMANNGILARGSRMFDNGSDAIQQARDYGKKSRDNANAFRKADFQQNNPLGQYVTDLNTTEDERANTAKAYADEALKASTERVAPQVAALQKSAKESANKADRAAERATGSKDAAEAAANFTTRAIIRQANDAKIAADGAKAQSEQLLSDIEREAKEDPANTEALARMRQKAITEGKNNRRMAARDKNIEFQLEMGRKLDGTGVDAAVAAVGGMTVHPLTGVATFNPNDVDSALARTADSAVKGMDDTMKNAGATALQNQREIDAEMQGYEQASERAAQQSSAQEGRKKVIDNRLTQDMAETDAETQAAIKLQRHFEHEGDETEQTKNEAVEGLKLEQDQDATEQALIQRAEDAKVRLGETKKLQDEIKNAAEQAAKTNENAALQATKEADIRIANEKKVGDVAEQQADRKAKASQRASIQAGREADIRANREKEMGNLAEQQAITRANAAQRRTLQQIAKVKSMTKTQQTRGQQVETDAETLARRNYKGTFSEELLADKEAAETASNLSQVKSDQEIDFQKGEGVFTKGTARGDRAEGIKARGYERAVLSGGAEAAVAKQQGIRENSVRSDIISVYNSIEKMNEAEALRTEASTISTKSAEVKEDFRKRCEALNIDPTQIFDDTGAVHSDLTSNLTQKLVIEQANIAQKQTAATGKNEHHLDMMFDTSGNVIRTPGTIRTSTGANLSELISRLRKRNSEIEAGDISDDGKIGKNEPRVESFNTGNSDVRLEELQRFILGDRSKVDPSHLTEVIHIVEATREALESRNAAVRAKAEEKLLDMANKTSYSIVGTGTETMLAAAKAKFEAQHPTGYEFLVIGRTPRTLSFDEALKAAGAEGTHEAKAHSAAIDLIRSQINGMKGTVGDAR